MREPKNAVNFASKTWSIGIGGVFTLSLGACLYIYFGFIENAEPCLFYLEGLFIGSTLLSIAAS